MPSTLALFKAKSYNKRVISWLNKYSYVVPYASCSSPEKDVDGSGSSTLPVGNRQAYMPLASIGDYCVGSLGH